MNRIHINGKGINLDQIITDCAWSDDDDTPMHIVNFTDGTRLKFYNIERQAIAAWLNVPNHMAGIIDPIDRDVMAWWVRQQERADYNKTVAQFKPGTLFRDKHDGVIYTVINTFQMDGDTNVYGQVVGGGEHERDWMSIDDCEIVTETEA